MVDSNGNPVAITDSGVQTPIFQPTNEYSVVGTIAAGLSPPPRIRSSPTNFPDYFASLTLFATAQPLRAGR